jgi:hypothetical protein
MYLIFSIVVLGRVFEACSIYKVEHQKPRGWVKLRGFV